MFSKCVLGDSLELSLKGQKTVEVFYDLVLNFFLLQTYHNCLIYTRHSFCVYVSQFVTCKLKSLSAFLTFLKWQK